eukprot:TRINITY_DN31968_c0_g3_i1.p1 TRINITY_DN31968_c0_g3~~TRINITY_DN31968_c0_g3_i1.p1  ORF type:complete len:412 (-),score=38.74 TRINITY_DN31968_c0_g3_i1:98-1333(-)
MDPLSLLREYQLKKQLDKVVVRGDRIEFGDSYSFLKTHLTAFKSQRGGSDFYTLECVWFFLKKIDLKHTEYIVSAKQNGVPPVTFLDRQELFDYLTGAISESQYIMYTDDAGLQQIQAGAQAQAGEGGSLKRNRQDAGMDAEGVEGKQQLDGEAVGNNQQSDQDGQQMDELMVGDGKHTCKRMRDRNSMLIVPLRDFSKVLEIVKSYDQSKQKQPQKQPQRHSQQHRHQSFQQRGHYSKPREEARLPIKTSGRFDRDTATNQLNDLKDESLKNLNFNVYGYKANSNPVPSTPAQSKHERQHNQTPKQGSSSHKSSSSKHHNKHHSSSRSSKYPIILVPSGYSAVVNLFNIKQFLEEGVFQSVEQCQQAGIKKPKMEIVRKQTKGGKTITYHVKDKAPDGKNKAKSREPSRL